MKMISRTWVDVQGSHTKTLCIHWGKRSWSQSPQLVGDDWMPILILAQWSFRFRERQLPNPWYLVSPSTGIWACAFDQWSSSNIAPGELQAENIERKAGGAERKWLWNQICSRTCLQNPPTARLYSQDLPPSARFSKGLLTVISESYSCLGKLSPFRQTGFKIFKSGDASFYTQIDSK